MTRGAIADTSMIPIRNFIRVGSQQTGGEGSYIGMQKALRSGAEIAGCGFLMAIPNSRLIGRKLRIKFRVRGTTEITRYIEGTSTIGTTVISAVPNDPVIFNDYIFQFTANGYGNYAVMWQVAAESFGKVCLLLQGIGEIDIVDLPMIQIVPGTT